jgi:hypothetical protein
VGATVQRQHADEPVVRLTMGTVRTDWKRVSLSSGTCSTAGRRASSVMMPGRRLSAVQPVSPRRARGRTRRSSGGSLDGATDHEALLPVPEVDERARSR